MNQPMLTIGLVVRNGQRHLDQAIRSLREQTFGDFALVVYDNASTDETPAIVGRHAADDARIQLVRREKNIGALGNFIQAAREARTPHFCWATHDDVRQPACLESLINLLESNTWASLACCAARDMDPDGTLGEIRPETAAIMTTRGLSPAERLRAYLPLTPCTPIYGVYRTAAIHSVLPALEANARPGMGVVFAGDIVFLAAFLREHHMVATPEPLLHFRRGGFSHDASRFQNLAAFRTEYAAFARRLREETARAWTNGRDRRTLALHRWWVHARILASKAVRSMISELMLQRMPRLRSTIARVQAAIDPAFRRLGRRLRRLPAGSSVAIFGAGRHTQRHWDRFQTLAKRAGVNLACVVDDRAQGSCGSSGVPIVRPDAIAESNVAVLIVSSDTYERAMYMRACEVSSRGCAVWCMYDQALESEPSRAPQPDLAARVAAVQPAVGAAA